MHVCGVAEPPQAVNFTERTATSLKFDIQRATTNAALYFRITTSQANVTNVTASKSVTLVGFTPFTAVTVLIRSCLPLKDKAELCGKDQSFETKTNVDGKLRAEIAVIPAPLSFFA